MTKRIVVVVIGLVVLLLIVLGFKAILGSSSLVDTSSLYGVLGEQVELNGLANTAIQDTQNQQYLNLTYTVIATTTNDKNKLVSLLNGAGVKLNPKLLVLQPAADQQLASAKQTDSFDSAYIPVMKQQLELYQQEIATAYAKNKSPVIKSYLKSDYNDSVLLLKMLNSSAG